MATTSLVATRDIKQGELILREMPLNRGPKMSSKPVCLGCNRELENADNLCPKGYLIQMFKKIFYITICF